MADAARLLGLWRMVSWTRETVSTGAISDAMGPDPVGYIAYHPDGTMMASVFRRQRPASGGNGWSDAQKAELFDSMLAYVATYSLDGDQVVHHVDAAWNPDWEIDLSRPFTLDGDTLMIGGAPGVDPLTGEKLLYRMEFRRA